MRRSDALAAAALVAFGVTVSSMQGMRGIASASSREDADDATQSAAEPSKAESEETSPPETIASSYIPPAALARLSEAARYDDWRAIDAAAAEAVAPR
jgi:hypothetical protein